mmetsp:Transcript_6564/g.24370  ORF Transcript_6564/g.24370 Transcript_6564/m.24370 type:complete len:512 (+) Transcript_6564:199-1734(+)
MSVAVAGASASTDAGRSSLNGAAVGSQPKLSGKDRYLRSIKLGEGAFGEVYLAEDKLTNTQVAVKKIRLGQYREGVNVTALREIKLLREIHSPYVINLIDVYPHKKNIHLVFEYMESDLEAVIKDTSSILSAGDIKSYMQMTLQGLKACHEQWIIHRDMKPNNLLIRRTGELQLADFGLARIFGSPKRNFTNQVFARWYRAPELLFGCKEYGPSVDCWAAGCVLGELVLRKPLFPGQSDIDQLARIFTLLGTPTEEIWPGLRSLPDYVEYAKCAGQPLKQVLRNCSDDLLDLLRGLLTYNPSARLTAPQALHHPYFSNLPRPTPPGSLPKPPQRNTPQLNTANNPVAMAIREQQELQNREREAENAAAAQQRNQASAGKGCAEQVTASSAGVAEGAEEGAKRPAVGAPGANGESGALHQRASPLEMSAGMISKGRESDTTMQGSKVSVDGHMTTGTAPGQTPASAAMGMLSSSEAKDMSTDASNHRPYLNSEDKQYLRKRKLEMDRFFGHD